MTKEEVKTELGLLQKRFDFDRSEIYKRYALAHNPYKIGDLITDHVATIKIEKIKFHISYGESQCVYVGTQYNKDGKVNKKQDHNTIFQNNIIKQQP